MSGPKHLWAGDWERESARAAERLAGPPPPPVAPPPVAPPPSRAARPPVTAHRPRRSHRPQLAAAAAGLIVVAVALALALSSGGSPASSGGAAGAPNAQAPAPQPTLAQKPVHWLGMQITASARGGAVIDTVALGSPGDAAGFEPGDVIVSVDNHSISSPGQIKTALGGTRPGQQVSIQVDRGSSIYTAILPMAALPTTGP